MPSTPGIVHLISFALAGFPPAAWFSQTPFQPLLSNGVGRKLLALTSAARLKGVTLPLPRFSDIHRPVEMINWIQQNCPRGALVATFPGSALHFLQTSRDENASLPPLTFVLGGEPVTSRKRRALESAGHRVFPWFGTVEMGRISVGCLHPNAADDMHLLSDRFAIIGRPESSGQETPQAKIQQTLLFTTLLPSAHKLLLNVESGDSGVIEVRRCGCPWDREGLACHVHSLQSIEKLNLEGMTFDAEALVRLADEILPDRAGGTPIDYQFAEEEGKDGLTRLVVRVSPTVRASDALIIDNVLDVLYKSKPILTPMTDLLARAGAVEVRREYPRINESGKIIPLRQNPKSERYKKI